MFDEAAAAWKGTARSLNSALNEIQRDRQRAQRDYERQEAALAKMAEVERAAAEIELFEEYIDDLITLHHNDAPDVDWAGLAASSELHTRLQLPPSLLPKRRWPTTSQGASIRRSDRLETAGRWWPQWSRLSKLT